MATSVISATAPSVVSNMVSTEKQVTWDDSPRSLVQRAQHGDERAFAALFQTHQKRVYSLCLMMTKNIAEAEDLTQEAFLQVFRKIGSFRGDAAFSTWLYRVAVNTVLMKLRRRKAEPAVSLDQPVGPESTQRRDFGSRDLALAGVIDRIALRRAIQELPEGCRRVFSLHEIEGYQHHEIAQLLRCSVGTSKSQLHKAKSKMRDLLFPKTKSMGREVEGVEGADQNDRLCDLSLSLSYGAGAS